VDWNAIAAIGQLAGAAAVLITLIYLARQVRQANRQGLLDAFRHSYDSLNDWALSVVESEEVASIILRGRQSYAGLGDTDRLRFDHIHLMFLNIIESHYFQVQKTAMDEAYRRWAIENLTALVRGYLDFPGFHEFWAQVQQFYDPAIRRLIAKNTGRVSSVAAGQPTDQRDGGHNPLPGGDS
jgi:hypothetical protein